MIDSVLKGTGNSRFLKSAVPAGTSWADALAMLQAGTFPIDFNGINTEGFQQVGTPLNKANLLKDATAAQIGLPPSTTPDGMFQALGNTGELHVWRKTVTTSQEIPAGYTLGDALENINPIKLTDRNYNTAWFTVVSSVKIDDNGNAQFTDADSDYTRYMRWNSSEHAFEGYDAVSGNGPGSIRHDAIPGNFIKFWAKSSSWLSPLIDTDSFYFVPSDATVTTGSTPVFSKLQRVVGYAKIPAGTTTTYPVSTNPNAYQEGDDAKPAGYTLGEVETGKFVLGTGVGSNAQNMFYISSSVTVDDSGNISQENRGSTYINGEDNNTMQGQANNVIGKFVVLNSKQSNSDFDVGTIWYIPPDVTIRNSYSTDGEAYDQFNITNYVTKRQPVTGYAAIPAGTTIEYLGKLGDKARVQVVSYVGTGTYGESNPNSLTFNFAPKIVKFLFQVEAGIGNHSKIENFQQDGEQYYMVSDRLTTEFAQGEGFGYNSYAVRGKKSADGKTFTWYTGIGSQAQGNQNGMKYYFIAFG